MATTVPRVSIGVPVYNGETFLPSALDSLLGQTFTDCEIVISDNASTDSTPDICRAYANRDGRIRYHRSPTNRGLAWNFNRVFELSRGEFFKWAAHDDLCAPRMIERCVYALDQHPMSVLAYPRTALINEQGKVIALDAAQHSSADSVSCAALQPLSDSRRDLASSRPSRRYLGVLLYSIGVQEMFGLIRHEAMKRTGLHRPFGGAEKVILGELSLLGPFVEVPEVLFHSRRHDQRYSQSGSTRAQNASMDPRASRRIVVPRQFRTLGAQIQVIRRADITFTEKVGCSLALVRYILQVRKWRRVSADILRSFGIGERRFRRPAEASTERPLVH